MEELRSCLIPLITMDKNKIVTNAEYVNYLVSSFSVLRGLTRALRWIVTNGSNPSSGNYSSTNLNSFGASGVGANSDCSPSKEADLVGFLWSSIFLPVLQNCSTFFIQVGLFLVRWILFKNVSLGKYSFCDFLHFKCHFLSVAVS